MAIAATFTLAYFLHYIECFSIRCYFAVTGWVVIRGNEEIDLAKEVQDFMIMWEEHFVIFEGGPIMTRILIILVDALFISE